MCNVTPVSEIEKSRREKKERNRGSYSYSIKLEENRLMVSLSYQSLINQSSAQHSHSVRLIANYVVSQTVALPAGDSFLLLSSA